MKRIFVLGQQIEFTRDPALKMVQFESENEISENFSSFLFQRGLIPLDENLIRSLIVSIQVPVLLIG